MEKKDPVFLCDFLRCGSDDEIELRKLYDKGWNVVIEEHIDELYRLLCHAKHIKQLLFLIDIMIKKNISSSHYLLLVRSLPEITRKLLSLGFYLTYEEFDQICLFIRKGGSDTLTINEFLTQNERNNLESVLYHYYMYGHTANLQSNAFRCDITQTIKSPLELAAARGESARLKMLLEASDFKNPELENALAFAAGRRNYECFKILIGYNACPNKALEVLTGILQRRASSSIDLYKQMANELRAKERDEITRENSIISSIEPYNLPLELWCQLRSYLNYQRGYDLLYRFVQNQNLIEAVQDGDEPKIKEALSAGADPGINDDNTQPLWLLLLNSRMSNDLLQRIFAILLRYGWFPEQPCADGLYLFPYLVQNQDLLGQRVSAVQQFVTNLYGSR